MNLKFWIHAKREATPPPKPRKLTIPADQTRRICKLLDTYQSIEYGDHTARFDLWSTIAEIFPEVREGRWTIQSDDALKITIIERLPRNFCKGTCPSTEPPC